MVRKSTWLSGLKEINLSGGCSECYGSLTMVDMSSLIVIALLMLGIGVCMFFFLYTVFSTLFTILFGTKNENKK